jgi:hypothetical protein
VPSTEIHQSVHCCTLQREGTHWNCLPEMPDWSSMLE